MKKKKLKLPTRINKEPPARSLVLDKRPPVRVVAGDTRAPNPPHGASLPRRAVRPQPVSPAAHKKLAKAASKEIQAAVASQGLPTDVTMAADTFNVLHCRVALNDGISVHASTILAREKLFGVIATLGWERTIQVLASCARLFAEVPAAPLPKLSAPAKDQLHKLAAALDSQHINLRFVDREIAG